MNHFEADHAGYPPGVVSRETLRYRKTPRSQTCTSLA